MSQYHDSIGETNLARIENLAAMLYQIFHEQDGTVIGKYYDDENGDSFRTLPWAELNEAAKDRWRAVANFIRDNWD